MSRLENYKQRLKDDAPAPPPPPAKGDDREKEKDKDRDSASINSRAVSIVTMGSIKGKGTDHVWRLFGMPEEQLAGKLKELSGPCSEAAALEDLKVSMRRLRLLARFSSTVHPCDRKIFLLTHTDHTESAQHRESIPLRSQ